MLAVAAAAEAEGGIVERDDSSAAGTALRVRFPSDDRAVFWFPSNDALVNFRSERVAGSLWDGSANKLGPMSKTTWRRPRPAGSPKAPLSVRSCRGLPRASAILGQSAGWAALLLAGHVGPVFD